MWLSATEKRDWRSTMLVTVLEIKMSLFLLRTLVLIATSWDLTLYFYYLFYYSSVFYCIVLCNLRNRFKTFYFYWYFFNLNIVNLPAVIFIFLTCSKAISIKRRWKDFDARMYSLGKESSIDNLNLKGLIFCVSFVPQKWKCASLKGNPAIKAETIIIHETSFRKCFHLTILLRSILKNKTKKNT